MRLLFVENHATFARVVTEQFLSEFHVIFAGSLADARGHLATEVFDAVLVDFDLDDGKGDVLVRELHASGFAGKIVAISAHDEGNGLLVAAGATASCPKAQFRRIREILSP